MVILDAPYASQPLLDWLCASGHPVLANDFSRMLANKHHLSLVDHEEAIARVDAKERIYTNSENALAWIMDNTHNESLKDAITLFKNKAAMREALSALNPDLFFATYEHDELITINPDELPLPVVLKPSVGFCSMGVYVIENAQDWADALNNIAAHEHEWRERYPESVVGGEVYLIESYITGQEYAIDMYYDSEGEPVILNILRHDFAGPEDTSDRLYLTNKEVIDKTHEPFRNWLVQVNQVVGARNIPLHVEIRTEGDLIAPIEFNPLRFAGLGGTDVAFYGTGLRTYEAYLEDLPVSLPAIYKAHPTDTYSMSLLNPAPEADLSRPFDYEAFAARFSDVLAFHHFDPTKVGSYGFIFLRTDASTTDELDFMLHSDLLEFQQ